MYEYIDKAMDDSDEKIGTVKGLNDMCDSQGMFKLSKDFRLIRSLMKGCYGDEPVFINGSYIGNSDKTLVHLIRSLKKDLFLSHTVNAKIDELGIHVTISDSTI